MEDIGMYEEFEEGIDISLEVVFPYDFIDRYQGPVLADLSDEYIDNNIHYDPEPKNTHFTCCLVENCTNFTKNICGICINCHPIQKVSEDEFPCYLKRIHIENYMR